ncbi:MAG: hypothetical protein FH758_08110 [Firmicutes bacterium]|nr:hypothetical protein [Bacillota bacterium]
MIIVVLISLLVTMIIHEFAHCWGAYKYGYRPRALMLGFGPRLLSFRLLNIPTTINLLPFGAGIKLPPSFEHEKWYRRLLVNIYGPLINLMVGFWGLIFMIVIIFLINGSTFVAAITGAIQFAIGLSNIGNELATTFKPEVLVGLGMGEEATKWGGLLKSSFSWSNALIFFFATNLVIGIINLVPFPPLDGAHIVDDIINGITGRRIPKIIDSLGYVILMILTVVYVVTLLGYPFIYTWLAVGAGILLGVLSFIIKKKEI